jgi:hypothetical protein
VPGDPVVLVRGPNILNEAPVSVKPLKKGMVVVFMSARCPCSSSHVEILKKLAKAHPDFAFVGVHSNADENEALSKPYFERANLPFPVIQDRGDKIADQFHAFKTPHSYLVSAEGKMLFRGGVTNSHEGPTADKQYLSDALDDIEAGRPVRVPEARTLGCTIAR